MNPEIRAKAARYYDCNPNVPDDIPFYRRLIRLPATSVLELGCGTGRVAVELAPHVDSYHGVDHSSAMLEICMQKLTDATLGLPKAVLHLADITAVELGRTFDLIIAPFRVMQNLESDAEVEGFLDVITCHLGPSGTFVANAFNPRLNREDIVRDWCRPDEHLSWQAPYPGGRVECFSRRGRMDPERLVLYPELVYRQYDDAGLREEVALPLVMRCYYPDDFEELFVKAGFAIVNRWGGYHGEAYGHGPDLILECVLSTG